VICNSQPYKEVTVDKLMRRSHGQMVTWLGAVFASAEIHTLPARKWSWKLRTSALWAAAHVKPVAPTEAANTTVFCSSMINVCELWGLRPDLVRAAVMTSLLESLLALVQYGFVPQARCHKVLYFHENQLVYPSRTRLDGKSTTSNASSTQPAPSSVAGGESDTERDFQLAWMQIMSVLSSDVCLFNSHFNRSSFIEAIPHVVRKIPEKALQLSDGPHSVFSKFVLEPIAAKSFVLHFPVALPPVSSISSTLAQTSADKPLRICWNHRWEYDKCPELFIETLRSLADSGESFQLTMLGESFSEVPEVITLAKAYFLSKGLVRHWGYVSSKLEYWEKLAECDVVVSTAIHEFFGVSIVEAVCLRHAGHDEHFEIAQSHIATKFDVHMLFPGDNIHL
jgi:hypothetical protein